MARLVSLGPTHWHDTHFEVARPVVAQMQPVFIDNWIKVTGHVLHRPVYFPELVPEGRNRAQMLSGSPTGGSESMELMYLLAVTAASRSIDLSASYFVPDELTLQALTEALKRGQAAYRRPRQAHGAIGRGEKLAERLASVIGSQL